MNRLLTHFEFTVFDLETTGYDPEKGAEIIEIGAVRLNEGKPDEQFQRFVKPEEPIPGEIQDLTGIGPSDVEDAPPVDEVLPEFLDFIGDSVLVAHNMEFDMSFLDYYAGDAISFLTVDTLTICRRLESFSSNKLDDLTKRFDIHREDAHRAHEDARATGELLRILAARINSLDDYERCEVPETLVEEDLDLILPSVPGLSSSAGEELAERFGRVSHLLDVLWDPELEISDLQSADRKHLKQFFEEWHQKDNLDSHLKKHGKGPSMVDSLNTRYWTWANWTLNAVGGLLICTAVIGTRSPELFYRLVTLSIPFFLSSPLLIHLRGQPNEQLKKILALTAVFGLSALYFYTL